MRKQSHSFFSQEKKQTNSDIEFNEELSFGWGLAPFSGGDSLQLSIAGDETDVRKTVRDILFGGFQKDGICTVSKQESSIPAPHLQINLRLMHGSSIVPIFQYLIQVHDMSFDFSSSLGQGNAFSYYDSVKKSSVYMSSPYWDAHLAVEQAMKRVKNGEELTIKPHDETDVGYLFYETRADDIRNALLSEDEKLSWSSRLQMKN